MSKINKITSEELDIIIEDRKPLGLFYVEHEDIFIACDNSTGDAWVEEFTSYAKCQKYLLRL